MIDTSAVLIAGPTASGKSALALDLAERHGGLIVNADSMQVYRELRVLTARPSADEEARVPHALYGHVPGAEAYSAGRFVAEAGAAIAAAREEGRLPIIVGGTGLYFKALLEGLSPIPPIPSEVRSHWRAEAARRGAEALHGELRDRDPETAARLRPSDPQRVVRALEVLEATGRPLSYWQNLPGVPVIQAGNCLRLVVSPERDEVYRRCDARFEGMIEKGAVEEVRALAGQGLDPALPVMRALGVRPLLQYVQGELELDRAVTAAKLETRQYVKRQQTWLRRNMIAWKSI
jgi:tRNA dimethylallyltransferase